MKRPGAWVSALSVAIAVAVMAACVVIFVQRRSQNDAVACVVRIAGEVERDQRGREQWWNAAVIGDRLAFGDALRTGPGARATVQLVDGSSLELEPNTLVRFLADQPSRARFRVDTGLAMLQSGGAGVSFATDSGFVRLDPRSRVRLTQDQSGTRLDLRFGRAAFIDGAQASQPLSAGDELVMLRGKRPELRTAEDRAKPRNAIRPGDTLKTEKLPLLSSSGLLDLDLYPEGAPSEAQSGEERAARAARADVTVRAGERVTIHHGSPTTTVRLRIDDACEGQEGSVDVARRRGHYRPVGSGTSAVMITTHAGITRYRVRCPGGKRAKVVAGVLRVLHDSAERRVPLRAPTNSVDLDGHRYTVMYQNRLPNVVVRYVGKPAASPLRLVVRSGSRMRTYEASGNYVKLASGQLDDGEHRLFFESLDGKTRSPSTALRIGFDNAAPTASIDQHGELVADVAGKAHVSGVVPEGSRVSLEGNALVIDASGRFSGSARVPNSDQAIALRVAHPRAGVHYYVRRVAGEAGRP